MKKWKQLICIGLTCALMSAPFSAFAESGPAEAAEGQLTLEDLSAMNGGAESVFEHDGRVTFVDGKCSRDPVTDPEAAAAVVDSVMTLIGADANTEFVPWREVTDPKGNHYYIFQQVYNDTTVLGGAVKVITDPDGNMIALSSSVESEMPEADPSEGISAEEAQAIVAQKEAETASRSVEILSQYTSTVILPSSEIYDVNTEKHPGRFAWVVYTNNYSENVKDGSDLPYLAHYVSMSGEYLYNMPAVVPDDEAGRSGYNSSYVFEFMEPVDYTGYVDLSDGTEKEITVTVMRDQRTGMYYLGNIERRILVAQCYDFLYDGGRVVLEASPDNKEWDQVGLLSLYNYCRAWDYYNEIGWNGGDGDGTPILILNNFCDDHLNEINNACYIGKVYGMQCFAASRINDLSQCLDVIGHEFTHCVTQSLMTHNSYMNDYGAINEAMSDIQGKNCDMMAGSVDADNWWMGAASLTPVRNMQDPHATSQPEYTWDLYYRAKVETPTVVNDHGGVHTNSSLLNRIAYLLFEEGGMTMEDARIFWFMTDCAMVPGTDYAQLAEILPWVLKAAGMPQYEEALAKAIEETRLGIETKPETMDDDRALVTVSLPNTEAFDTGNWMLLFTSIDLEKMADRLGTIAGELDNEDYSSLPESLQLEIAKEKEEKEQQTEAPPKSKGEIISSILEALFSGEEETEALTELPEEAGNDPQAVLQDIQNWLKEELSNVRFSANANAGQDGSTLSLVVRPGRTVPLLIHMNIPEASQTPDQVVQAIYLNGKWIDLGILTEAAARGENQLLTLISMVMNDIQENDPEKLDAIDSLDDILDLFTVKVQGGEMTELSSEGLDQIVIPEPTPPEEKTYGTIGAGKKSRPKQEAMPEEALTEEADEAA